MKDFWEKGKNCLVHRLCHPHVELGQWLPRGRALLHLPKSSPRQRKSIVNQLEEEEISTTIFTFLRLLFLFLYWARRSFPFYVKYSDMRLGVFFLSLSLSQHSSFEPIASTSHRPPANRTASSGHSILHFMQFPPRSRKLAPSHLFFYPLSTRHLLRGRAWLFKAAVRSSQVSVEPKSV